MRKQELLKKLSEELGMSMAEVERVSESLLGLWRDSLLEGEDVMLWGIGKLEPCVRKGREGRNPQTGESLQIPDKKSAKFKLSKKLKQEMNEG